MGDAMRGVGTAVGTAPPKGGLDARTPHRGYRDEASVVGRGSRDRTRTCDPVINSHLLYQLSYAGIERES